MNQKILEKEQKQFKRQKKLKMNKRFGYFIKGDTQLVNNRTFH